MTYDEEFILTLDGRPVGRHDFLHEAKRDGVHRAALLTPVIAGEPISPPQWVDDGPNEWVMHCDGGSEFRITCLG